MRGQVLRNWLMEERLPVVHEGRQRRPHLEQSAEDSPVGLRLQHEPRLLEDRQHHRENTSIYGAEDFQKANDHKMLVAEVHAMCRPKTRIIHVDQKGCWQAV